MDSIRKRRILFRSKEDRKRFISLYEDLFKEHQFSGVKSIEAPYREFDIDLSNLGRSVDDITLCRARKGYVYGLTFGSYTSDWENMCDAIGLIYKGCPLYSWIFRKERTYEQH